MPSASKANIPPEVENEIMEGRYVELDGYTVGFETFKQDFDPAPLFHGLPDDRCQSPHWGYVLSGKLTFRYADHDETFVAGDAYYGAAGHTPLVYAGTEVVEFSPTHDFAATMEVIGRNLEAMSEPA
jgi:hypothetical protein